MELSQYKLSEMLVRSKAKTLGISSDIVCVQECKARSGVGFTREPCLHLSWPGPRAEKFAKVLIGYACESLGMVKSRRINDDYFSSLDLVLGDHQLEIEDGLLMLATGHVVEIDSLH